MTKKEKRTPSHKRIRGRLLPLVLAVVMMMALLVPGMIASAAEMNEPPTIIINAPAGMMFSEYNDIFEAYKIFDVTFSGDNYSYVLVPEFAAFDDYPGSGDGVTLQEYLDSMPSATEMTELATALLFYIRESSPAIDSVGDVEIEGNKATIDLDVADGGYGYYIVWHTIGTYPEYIEDYDEYFMYGQLVAACLLTTTNPIANVTAKTDAPTLNKFIVSEDGTYSKYAGVTVGDVVKFALEVTIPKTFEGYEEYDFVVHDELFGSSGHELLFMGYDDIDSSEYVFAENFTVSIWEKGNPTTKTTFTSLGYEITTSAGRFDIEFVYDALKTIPEGYSLLIEYTAVVNMRITSGGYYEEARRGNSAWLTFSADPYNEGNYGSGGTPMSNVFIYTCGLNEEYKVNGDSWNDEYEYYEESLFGAEFNLYKLEKRNTPDADGSLYDIGSPLLCGPPPYTGNHVVYDGHYFEEHLNDPEYYANLVHSNLEMMSGEFVKGLGPGLYMLKEVKAPDGFNIMTYNVFFEIELVERHGDANFHFGANFGDPFDYDNLAFVKKVYFDTENEFLYDTNPTAFTIFYDMTNIDWTSDNPADWDGIHDDVYIENFSGTLFPGTGGPGTAIFFATSAILTIGLAAFYTISRKKKTATEK